ncbi:MAG: hypothetical protein KJ896_02280, partial [Nanoarchaeota archaeon]|nr:hypothetical protein [Nanoarchaeota archaeon]
ITLTPNFITRAHTSFGEIVTATGSSKENITIKTGTNDITLTLPKAGIPQSYNLTFNLTSSNPKTITNTITFNYALMGENGTIQNVVFDKTSYKTGETANLQIFSTQTSTGTLAVLVSNDSNAPCSTTSIKQIDSFSIINLQIPIIKDCTNPKANITLSSNDKVLDSSNFEITTPVSTTTLITLTNKNIIIIIALIILALIFTILIFKKKSLKVLIFIFVFSASFFGLNKVSYAWDPIIQEPTELSYECLPYDNQIIVLLRWRSGFLFNALRINNLVNGWSGKCDDQPGINGGDICTILEPHEICDRFPRLKGTFCEPEVVFNKYLFLYSPQSKYDWWVHNVYDVDRGWLFGIKRYFSDPTHGNQIVCPPIVSLSADPNPVPYGKDSTISFTAFGHDKGCKLTTDGNVIVETPSDSGGEKKINNITSNHDYSVSCTDSVTGITTKSISVKISSPPVITFFYTHFNPVSYNSSTTISWGANKADFCEIKKNDELIQKISQVKDLCVDRGGVWQYPKKRCFFSEITDTQKCTNISGWINQCYKQYTPGVGRENICHYGCQVEKENLDKLSDSVDSGPLTADTTFSAKCTNNGTPASASVIVKVTPLPEPKIIYFTSLDAFFDYGTSTDVTWSVTDAKYCSIVVSGKSLSEGTHAPVSSPFTVSGITGIVDLTLKCFNPSDIFTTKGTSLYVHSPTVKITATPNPVIKINDSTTISADVKNVEFCTSTINGINPLAHKMVKVESKQITITNPLVISKYTIASPTTFKIFCSGPTGDASDSVTVSHPPPPTVSLQAERDTIPTDSSTTLTGIVSNSTSCTLTDRPTPPGPVTWTSNGNFSYSSGNLALATTFTVSCNGPGGGPVSSSKTVSVSPLPIIESFQANPNPVMFRDGILELSFSVFGDSSGGCKMFRGKDEIKSFAGAFSDSFTGSSSQTNIKGTTNFKLSCTNNVGTSEKSINVTTKPIPITLEMSANGNHSSSLSFPPINKTYEIGRGKSLTISWSSTGADSCGYEKLQKGNSLEKLQSIATSGSTSTGKMLSETTFVIHCENESLSSVENQVKILVIQPPKKPLEISVNDNGDQRKIIWEEIGDQFDSCSYKKEGDTTEIPFNPGENTDLLLEDAEVKYTFTCKNEKDSQSITIVVPPSIRSICTVLQSGNTSGNIYVNRNTTWGVEPYSNLVKEITSRT